MFNTAEGQVAQHPSGAGPEAQNHSLDEILFGLSCECLQDALAGCNTAPERISRSWRRIPDLTGQLLRENPRCGDETDNRCPF